MGKGQRLGFYDISSANELAVKTFDGKVFKLRMGRAIEQDTGNIMSISDIYYQIRSVQDRNKKVIAKRLHRIDELMVI